jgi:hypothetical protein
VQYRPEANQNEGNIIGKSLEEKRLEKDGERATNKQNQIYMRDKIMPLS